jgi:hypothetical protein
MNHPRKMSMKITRPSSNQRQVYRFLSALSGSILAASWSIQAYAQDTPAETAPAEAPAVTAEAKVEAPPVEAPPAEPAPVEAAPAEAPAPAEPVAEAAPEPAPEEKKFEPSFTVGVGMRTGLSMTLSGDNAGDLSLNDGLVDQVHVRPYLGGSLTPHVGYWVQFEVGTANGLGSFAVLDAIAQIKFIDEVQLWVGQHIPANDRNNMNGPFFGNGWNFAITVPSYPFDVGARDRGATLWGLIAGGHIKYHASIVDLQPGRDISKARGAGRLTVHLLEPENFYYNSGTYFGKQDILTFGAVVQGQAKDAAVEDSNFFGFSFDGMFEKNLGGAGTITLEGGYWNFRQTGVNYAPNQGTIDGPNSGGVAYGISGPHPGESFLASVSWLTPDKVGAGYIQPNFRTQYFNGTDSDSLVFDAGLAYVVDGFNHKYHLNYRHAEGNPDAGPVTKEDSIQVGFQYLMGK